MVEPVQEFSRWAASAIAHYNLEATCKYIGHSDNITYQVTDSAGGEKYLLRLHEPITGHFVGMRQQPEAIRSELVWLEALCRDTDIVVPQPVHNRDGDLVTAVVVPGGRTVQATLLRWVEGEHIRLDAPDAAENVKKLGVLLARLHEHASGWPVPRDFVRPAYGLDFFNGVVRQLEPGLASGIIREGDFNCIRETIGRAGEMASGLQSSGEHWGLIHNDLHPGNCLVSGQDICPIDFSLCGFGYYLFDIGTSLGSLPQEFRSAFLAGYTRCRSLPGDWQRLVEGMLLVSRMSYYGLVLPDPSHQDWLKSRIPQVVETLCSRFLSGRSFLFDVR